MGVVDPTIFQFLNSYCLGSFITSERCFILYGVMSSISISVSILNIFEKNFNTHFYLLVFFVVSPSSPSTRVCFFSR